MPLIMKETLFVSSIDLECIVNILELNFSLNSNEGNHSLSEFKIVTS